MKAEKEESAEATKGLMVEEAAISYGSAPRTFRDVRQSLGLKQQQMQRVAGISVRSLSALETGKKAPSQDDIRRYRELSRLRSELGTVVAPGTIAPWLQTPNAYFGGSTPMDIIERGEIDRIWRLIWRLQDGVPLA